MSLVDAKDCEICEIQQLQARVKELEGIEQMVADQQQEIKELRAKCVGAEEGRRRAEKERRREEEGRRREEEGRKREKVGRKKAEERRRREEEERIRMERELAVKDNFLRDVLLEKQRLESEFEQYISSQKRLVGGLMGM